jgi:phosphate transport system substrate-binding protein
MGFSSFIAGDIGQRIVLKSSLLPVRTPGRKLQIRNELIKDNE